MNTGVTVSATRVVGSVTVFLFLSWVLNNLGHDVRDIVLPVVMVGVFAWSAKKTPPIAILILLYYSMTQGGWFILAAAPITMLLARRYQRQQLLLELNPVHIRRTVLIAVAAMAATLPFIGLSLGAWSSNSPSSGGNSARPLISPPEPGNESALQRLARWLGFGPDGNPATGSGEPLVPRPVQPRPPEPDDPFNWWILVAVVAALALALLAWWLWRRFRNRPEPGYAPGPAAPLARLEAVGERIGRPRAAHEGAITYGRELARATGDSRLAAVAPLVSGQVYQSSVANPRQVGANLARIESQPPPVPPQPTRRERLGGLLDRLPSKRALAFGLAGVLALVIAGWLIIPRLGELPRDRFESGAEQLQLVPFSAEHIDHL